MVFRGWKCESRYLGLSPNILEWNIGVYESRLFCSEGGRKERVSIRHAWYIRSEKGWMGERNAAGKTHKFRLLNHRRKHNFRAANTLIESPPMQFHFLPPLFPRHYTLFSIRIHRPLHTPLGTCLGTHACTQAHTSKSSNCSSRTGGTCAPENVPEKRPYGGSKISRWAYIENSGGGVGWMV